MRGAPLALGLLLLAAVCGTPLANGLLCWLLLLCFAKVTAKLVAMVLLMLCFESLSFAFVILKHTLLACFRKWLPVIYKLVC